MTNQEIAKILQEIGEYLEMQDVPFKPRAYEKVAEVIASFQEELSDIYKKGGLKAIGEIPGVGASIAGTIEELLKTGRSKHYEELKKKTPVNLSELSSVEGLGPKKINVLYRKLGITDLKELEAAVKTHKVKSLEGFGAKTEENILKGIGFLKLHEGRFSLGEALPIARSISERLSKVEGVERVEIAGSLRRMKETIGDADFLAIAKDPKSVMDFFVSMPEVGHVYGKGETKSSVKLKNGMDMDLRVVPKESYGAAMSYFIGSKDHNVLLRQLAIKKGFKLNEYGLFEENRKTKKQKNIKKEGNWFKVAGETEEGIYEKLGMKYIPPEIREAQGEIEASLNDQLPDVIGYDDLKGDLQVQTNWTDGKNSIEEMAKAAIAVGLDYIVITDHTKRLAMANGLDEKRIRQQWKEIDEINKKLEPENLKNKKPFKILKGTECDILKDGSMDLPDEILEKLDVVGASVHSLFNLSKEEQTERVKKAMNNPNVDIIFHPTGRLINKRPAYEVDMDELIAEAKKTGTVLEIDAFPDRLDLKDEYIRKCVKTGVKMSIDSDAHAAVHFNVLEFGIAQARRGWAEKKDIVNAWPVEKMLGMLK